MMLMARQHRAILVGESRPIFFWGFRTHLRLGPGRANGLSPGSLQPEPALRRYAGLRSHFVWSFECLTRYFATMRG